MERRRRRVSYDEKEKDEKDDEKGKFASSVSAPAGTRPCQPRGGRTEADIGAHHIACTPLAPDQAGCAQDIQFPEQMGRSGNARSPHQMTLGCLNQMVSPCVHLMHIKIHTAEHSFY